MKLVVPFTAGSATDILARTVGQKLTEMWGQSVVVDNRPGAGGTIGEAIVAKAAPDGYTLLVNSAAHAYNPSIYSGLSFDTVKDFIDVAPLAGQPNVLVVAPSTGYKTVADLIAAAKAKPGALNFGSAGTGSGTHINAEKFRLAAGIDVGPHPVQGHAGSADRHDDRAHHVFLFADLGGAAATYAKASSSRSASARRSDRACCRTCRRSPRAGFPGFDYNLWVGLFAPAGTPADIVDKIARDVARALAAPEVEERLTALGAEPMPMTPAEFTKFVGTEIDESGKVIKAANIKVQ